MINSRPRRREQLQLGHVRQQSRVDRDLRVDSDSGFAELGRVGQGGAIGDDREGVREGEIGDFDPGVEGDYVVFGCHCAFGWREGLGLDAGVVSVS